MSEQTYSLSYFLERHDPPITKAQLDALGRGGCDNMLVVSILGTPGGPGPLSIMPLSRRGDSPVGGLEGTLSDLQTFHVWALMAGGLGEALEEMGHPASIVCSIVEEIHRHAVLVRFLTSEQNAEVRSHLLAAAEILVTAARDAHAAGDAP